ncbi:putative pentatricopeptide repeat-containing protein At1g12700, mitochondrial [Hibiscus syriacus]|uniref:putative pentatricopeptide repeat-containing protein At1g12700, mitochondrial n=1 Tax=Hibiscus syriacus TaxID=106335 RepID=UPI001921B2AD|nr:putative pentatricopeptide repeat-containing protein At1g12700, mitochondrial [Hibiscus syriacus]
MQNSGLDLNIVCYNILIDGLCKAGHIEAAKELFCELVVNGLKPDVCTYFTITNGFCKERLPDAAYQLLSMGENDSLPNICCYNVMIRVFLQNNYISKAAHLQFLVLHNQSLFSLL